MEMEQLLGTTGTIIATVTYVPQIHHLITKKCADGISITMYLLWALSSLLMLAHAFQTAATMFIIYYCLNLTAIAIIIIFARKYTNRSCTLHLR